MLKPSSSPITEIYFRTLQEAHQAAQQASFAFPDPENVLFGLHELMINAIEHGNLEITYAEKTELLQKGVWLEEIERRLSLPRYANRKAHLAIYKEGKRTTALITDDGKGFDWKAHTRKHTPHALPHGRGILNAISISFTSVEYVPPGNCVIATV